MNNFLSWAGKNAPMVANALKGKKPGTQEFNQVWTQLAQQNPQGFENIQHQFIKNSHYDPAVNRVKKSTGFDPNTHSQAVQDAFWSTAVQHGVAGAERVIKGAGIKPGMSDVEIIDRLYAERGANNGMKYFPSSSQSVRNSVVDRFQQERRDALSMLT